jgi:hypothetical protein
LEVDTKKLNTVKLLGGGQSGWQRNVGQIGGGGQLVHSSSIAQTVAVASS